MKPFAMMFLLNFVAKSPTTRAPNRLPILYAALREPSLVVRMLSSASSSVSSSSSPLLKPWPQPVVECHGDNREEAFLEDHIGGPLYAHQATLPRLFVPSLEDTIEKFLPTALALAENTEEQETLQEACRVFPDEARELQERLLQRREDIKDSSWLQQWWNTLAYLQFRDPNVIYVSYILEVPHDETVLIDNESKDNVMPAGIKRGAAALQAAAEFRNLVCSGELPCDVMGRGEKKTPLCSTAYKYLFHSCRIPQAIQDSYKIYDPSRYTHAIVACRGHFYKIPFVNSTSGEPLSLQEYEDLLKQCLEAAFNEKDNVLDEIGLLTTSNRDDWTKARDDLIQRGGKKMAEALTTLESAGLMVCLDEEATPETRTEYSNHYWYGNPHNRWFDKSIQLVCTQNGKLGYIGEHSMADGMPAVGLTSHLIKNTYQDRVAADAVKSVSSKSPESSATVVQEIFKDAWSELSQDDMEHIQGLITTAKQDFIKLANEHELHTLEFTEYGSTFMKQAGFSPDAYVQMAIQLATYRLFGKQAATYESTQVRPFLHGRTETTRSVSPASKAFVERMHTSPKHEYHNKNARHEKNVLLHEAVDSHRKYIGDAAKGQGVDRHFLGLSMLVEEGESAPSLFSHPLFLSSKRWRVSTSTLPVVCPGFGEVVPDGVGIGYEVKPDMLIFTVTSRREHNFTERLCHLLDEALSEMSGLVELDTPAATSKL